jgi:hypothetical protein
MGVSKKIVDYINQETLEKSRQNKINIWDNEKEMNMSDID